MILKGIVFLFSGTAFSHSVCGKFICYFFFGLNMYTGSSILRNSIKVALTQESCFVKVCDIKSCRNVCGHFAILWTNYIANLVSSITILFIRPQSTLYCLNTFNDILRERVYEFEFIPAAWSIVLFLVIQFLAFFFHWKNADYSIEFITSYLPLYITQCLPIVTENMISVLLLIIQNCYQDVNRRLYTLIDSPYFLTNKEANMKESLIYLRKYYWNITDLANRITDCFGIDFFFAGVCSTVRFIYFLFLTLEYMAEQKVVNDSGGLVLPSYESIIFFMAVVGKFYFLCYRCDKVVSEVCYNFRKMYYFQR